MNTSLTVPSVRHLPRASRPHLRPVVPRAPFGEIIGGPQRILRSTLTVRSSLTPTRDVGVGDYAFWDRARRGRAAGLGLSGLLLKPIESKIASWVIGSPPAFKYADNDAASDLLNEWWAAQHPDLLLAYEEALGLGDYFLVVNADLTLTLIPPHVIRPLVDERDYSRIIGWTIRERYAHPTDPSRFQLVEDEYTATRRVRRVWNNATRIAEQVYPNLIGIVPIVHVPNRRNAEALFGRPEAEALVELLHRYGETLDAALDGNKRQGRPTPVVGGLGTVQEVDNFWGQYAKKVRRELADGTVEEQQVIEFDADKLLVLGGGGTFHWASPGPFAGETSALLQLLYYLAVEHSEIPEYVMGNAVSSSRASVETQAGPFTRFIEKKRALAQQWVYQLCRIVNAYQSSFTPNVAVAANVNPGILWEELSTKDEALALRAVEVALERGLIDRETALRHIPTLKIEKPADVLAKADQEADERRERFDQSVERRFERAENEPTAAAEAEAELRRAQRPTPA